MYYSLRVRMMHQRVFHLSRIFLIFQSLLMRSLRSLRNGMWSVFWDCERQRLASLMLISRDMLIWMMWMLTGWRVKSGS